MKVYINRQIHPGAYGGGNNWVKAFYEFTDKNPNVELLQDKTMNINPDVIVIAGIGNEGPQAISAEQAIMYKMYVKHDVKLVMRINENDARKGTNDVDDMLLKISEHIDATVFVSDWLKGYFNKKGWACKEQTVIVNGVQRSIFKPGEKFNNGKLNIVAHHWSDNRMKGADIYEKIDELVGEQPDKFAFTYIGRHQCNFKNTKVIRPIYGKALGEELGKHDVYVSASRFDPGPNHVLEALACALPTYVHNDGGGAVEFAANLGVYKNWDQLQLLLNATNPLSANKFTVDSPFNPYTLKSWKDCIDEYLKYLEHVRTT